LSLSTSVKHDTNTTLSQTEIKHKMKQNIKFVTRTSVVRLSSQLW